VTWAAIVKVFLEIVGSIAGYLRDRQLLDAGEAKATARFTGAALENVNEANRARVSAAADGVFVDPFDTASRRDVPDPATDPVRQPRDTG
jgi:hypothetical protein